MVSNLLLQQSWRLFVDFFQHLLGIGKCIFILHLEVIVTMKVLNLLYLILDELFSSSDFLINRVHQIQFILK